MSELPDTWTSTSLKTVANLVTGNTPSTKSPEYYGGNVPFVKPGDLDSADPITTTEQQLTELGAQQSRLVRAGTTLISCIGNLGKVGFAGVPLASNQQINSAEFHSEIVDDRYGYYLCKTLKPWMERESSATTIAILNKGKFGEAPFPLAPLAEQKRIADKLDTVLTRVDAVNTRLARVAPLLKRFRQSVLAAATSGRLTEDWRQEQSSFKKGQEIEWSDTTLRTCISSMSGGASPSVDDYSAKGVLALNKGDIKLYGHLASKKNQNRVPEIYATQHNNKIVRTGELLVTLRDLSSKADFLGLIAQYINAEVALPTQGMYKLNVNPNTNRKYLMYFSNSPAYREIMKREKVGATQVHLRNDQFLDIPIALPPTEEQTEIVRRVETLFAFADRLEARLAQAQTAATRLTPALLAKAFRGELVPQDPNDEPAAELLRRLAEKPATPAKRGRAAKAI